jgi:DNA-binding NarL/FixJ family response regulator
VLHEADDGAEFIKKMSRANKLPDACLLNMDVPIGDVFDHTIRISSAFPSIKILACSASHNAEAVEKILQCGAHGFIKKGLHPNEYVRVLASMKNSVASRTQVAHIGLPALPVVWAQQ